MNKNDLLQYAKKTASEIKLPFDKVLIPEKVNGKYIKRYKDLGGWILRRYWEEDYTCSTLTRTEWIYILKKNGNLSVFMVGYKLSSDLDIDLPDKSIMFDKFIHEPQEYPVSFNKMSYSSSTPISEYYGLLDSHSIYFLDSYTGIYSKYHRVYTGKPRNKYDYLERNFSYLGFNHETDVEARFMVRWYPEDGQGLIKALDELKSDNRPKVWGSKIVNKSLYIDTEEERKQKQQKRNEQREETQKKLEEEKKKKEYEDFLYLWSPVVGWVISIFSTIIVIVMSTKQVQAPFIMILMLGFSFFSLVFSYTYVKTDVVLKLIMLIIDCPINFIVFAYMYGMMRMSISENYLIFGSIFLIACIISGGIMGGIKRKNRIGE